MKLLRKILFPFSILYGIITSIRNYLFDIEILKSYSFDVPIICVGNLNVGGTGKTPQIEYLINLLSKKYKIATLSRGYKRKSKGFVLADKNSNAEILGDEPYQFYTKYKNIQVAVDSDRKKGIEKLLLLKNKPQIVLLDDAFQHRKVNAGFYILLTTFNDLYCNDFLLPTGNLRESSSGSKRANVIIVTKCPRNLDLEIQKQIQKKLKLNSNQKLFFSSIVYDDKIYSKNNSIKIIDIPFKEKLLIAGIANPKPFFDFLKNDNDSILNFPDHHNFSNDDLIKIKKMSENKTIITTEKDFMRLHNELIDNLFYLPIKSSFLNNQDAFDNEILKYIAKHI
jgi:tetraacyldisaccharide 4'-kinase